MNAGGDVQGDTQAALLPLLAHARRIPFVQAVRTLEAALAGHARLGHLGPATEERVRLRPELSLAFPASDVAGIERRERSGDRPPAYELAVTFLGIYGTSSPLPSYITQDLLDLEERGALQRRFLDLFNHRILSLFYRAARKYRCADAEEAGREGPWARRILALLGLGRAAAGDQDAAGERRLDGLHLIRFAPFLIHSPRSAAALEACLRRQFPGVPLVVEPFAASWTPIPGDQRSRLGVQGVALGRDFWLGEQVCNRSTTFRVAIGPLGYDDFLAFLPGGGKRVELEALLKVFNPDGLDCELAVSVTIRPAADAGASGDAGAEGHGFTSATLGDESQQLGLNVRLGAGDDPPGAVHTVRSTIKG